MKALEVKEMLCNDGKGGHVYYEATRDVYVHDVVIDAGIGDEVTIGVISDIHFNYFNQKDLDEADPVLMSSRENRTWLQDGFSLQHAANCYDVLGDMDLMVFNGDTMDHLSFGAMELMQREVWDRFPNVIATVGGHELHRQIQGKLPETMTLAERIEKLKSFWKHDVYYESKLLKNKVLAVGMCNNLWTLNEYQHERLKRDLALARENGWVVLLFMHEPICTRNPAHESVEMDSPYVLVKNHGLNAFPKDLYHGNSEGAPMVGGDRCDEVTNAVYDEIVNSGDIIRGVFTGHWHTEMLVDICAKKPDGTPTVIPQYIKASSVVAHGGVMRISVI